MAERPAETEPTAEPREPAGSPAEEPRQPEGSPDATPGETAEIGGDPPPSRRPRAGTPRSVADRLTIYVVRAFFVLAAAGLGVQGARAFSLPGPMAELSVITGVLVSCSVAVLLIVLEALFARSPIRTISAICFGLLMGLVLSIVFQPFVRLIVEAIAPDLEGRHEERFLSYLNLVTTCIFCYFGVTLLLATKDDFKFLIPFVEFRKQLKSRTPLVLDTSVFIDGRFQALVATGLIDQRLEVPRFVLEELQQVADSSDRSLRERGRRGMDILQDIDQHLGVEMVDFPLERDEPVDAGLLRMAVVHEGKLVTTDHNLTKRARLQDVPVLNVNELATALKPVLVPGEVLRVQLLRAGEEPGQAVGFLRDGTMVVVEDALDKVGQEISLEVTSAIQTSAGRMVFGKLRAPKKSRSRR